MIPNPKRLPLEQLVHPALLEDLAEWDGPVHVTAAVVILTCVGEDGAPFLVAAWDDEVPSWTVMGMLDMELTTARGRSIETDSDDDD